MRGVGNGAVLRQIQTLFRVGTSAGLTDRQLLERFVDLPGEPVGEAAFSALVERHGPMVLSACRQMIGDPHAADDAFQAVFLVLARKARWIRVDGSLGGWLYGVAHRVAAKSRTGQQRRRRREGNDPDAAGRRASGLDGPEAAVERDELRRIVHDELRRLPEKYRTPIVLCYLEGLTHDEAAARLCWPVGTVRGRMARARDLLRRRLTRRGVSLPAGGVAASLARDASAALVPHALVHNTTQAALASLGGASAVAGLATSAAVSLADGATKSMLTTKLKLAATGLVALGTTAGGAGAYLQESTGSAGDGVVAGQGATATVVPAREASDTERRLESILAADDAKNDVDGESIPFPFPDTITIEDPDAEEFRRISERRLRRYESVDPEDVAAAAQANKARFQRLLEFDRA